MSAITVYEDGYAPIFSYTEWMHRFECGCRVLTGWTRDGAAAALFVAHRPGPGPHDAAMERATEQYRDMCRRPAESRELANTSALDIVRAIAEQELTA